MRKIGLSALLMILLAVPAVPAAAQSFAPEYVESDPSDGEMMHQAPDQVLIRFSEPLDESSNMEVRDECGGRVDDGDVTINLSEMSVGIAKKPSGTYKVNYYAKGIRGLTGQTMGSFTFMVHGGESCDGSDGGHDGHNGNGGGGSDGKHDGHNSGQDGHDGMDMGDGDTDHSGMDHTSDDAAMDHDGSGDMDHKDHEKPGKGERKHHHQSSKEKEAKPQAPPPQAGPQGPLPTDVDGATVLLSLGLSLVVGVAGGWYLRTTAPR